MSFNVSCTPGKDAAAGYMQITENLPALVIYLDPVNVAIQRPTFPDGDLMLAKFCRELGREALRLAAAIDPGGETMHRPRHALQEGGPADA